MYSESVSQLPKKRFIPRGISDQPMKGHLSVTMGNVATDKFKPFYSLPVCEQDSYRTRHIRVIACIPQPTHMILCTASPLWPMTHHILTESNHEPITSLPLTLCVFLDTLSALHFAFILLLEHLPRHFDLLYQSETEFVILS